MPRTLRLAVAQSTVAEDPTDPESVRASGAQVRRLMREAHAGGARLVQFPEGAITYPDKHAISSGPKGTLAAADWGRVDWDVIRTEAEAVAQLAGELGLWVAFGSIHPLTPPHRPHNSLYIVSDQGELVGRYDKRYLSHSELSYLYTPGTTPLVFEVDGIRFGAALCIEAKFPELFAEYEQLDVDCVLLSAMADHAGLAVLAQAYAILYNYWVAYSVPAQFGATAPARIIAPGGRRLASCPAARGPGLAFADLDLDTQDPDISMTLRLARPWRRLARAGLYDRHVVSGDARSDIRTGF
ncbi:carbon-nitrogen hydrolase family protein [Kitasatospora acidiphila]|uniref:Carbon-nitrogen hydrolase family protein n=1 Tax=Kitasatospora acidiphila TaxID=2567942 RepID=A0A540WE70_9ACTN|nr:carbon-nitrogen hydrolase family protein [Kitasatospora acidiphila]TQF06704.1 carbon-nitrogen hydrolase family protein [Kitasatospora acidiphila]